MELRGSMSDSGDALLKNDFSPSRTEQNRAITPCKAIFLRGSKRSASGHRANETPGQRGTYSVNGFRTRELSRHRNDGNKSHTMLLWLLIAPFLLTCLGGCAAKTPPPGVYTLPPGEIQGAVGSTPSGEYSRYYSRPYRIEVGDILEFKARLSPEWDQVVRVLPDGNIRLPFLEDIKVAGKTIEQVQSLVREKYIILNSAVPEPTARSYIIQAGDLLEIKFYDNEQFNNTVLVRPDGRISLLLVNSIIAEGKTPEELQAELTKTYTEYLVDPRLVVIVRQFTTNAFYHNGKMQKPYDRDLETATLTLQSTLPPKIYIGGEVATPRVLDFDNHLTALRAIMSAGGYLYSANLSSIIILRRDFTEEDEAIAKYIVIDLSPDINGTSNSDITLEPFDVVIVPKTVAASARTFVEEYIYRITPQLRNFSMGFTFTKQVGTDKNENINVIP